jgi:predicted RNA binding protein YcfA (HicA-like mRNA interferase family)
MKRFLLIQTITKNGAVFVRHGRNHDIYENPVTGTTEQVPRHPDVHERLAKTIIKTLKT